MRRQLIAAVLAAALFAVVGIAPTGGLLAQEDGEAVEETPETETPQVPPPLLAPTLQLGERLTTASYDLEAQAIFTAPKPDPLRSFRTARSEQTTEKTEVRIAIALRNNLVEAPMLFSDSSFAADPAYPRLALVDGAGVERPLSLVDLPQHSVGQADVREIEGGMTARWTVGWTVPTDAAGQLELVARDADGNLLARWDLQSDVEPAGWEPPAGATPIAFGETVDWTGRGLEVTPRDFGTIVCGDPLVEYVTQVFALRFDVGNRDFTADVRWPSVTFPESAAVARWENGSSAAVTFESFSGQSELLQKVFADQAIVPSTVEPDFSRALIFATPRDGRLGSVTDSPEGVLLNLGDGTERWLSLSGEGTLPLNPALCEETFLLIRQALAFSPSLPFEVADPPLPLFNAGVQDDIAQELLGRALIGAARYFEENGTYAFLTSADLEATGVGVDFTNSLDLLVPGAVAWGTIGEEAIVFVTESESGRFFCAGNVAFSPSLFGSAETVEEIVDGCSPPVALPEEPPPGEGEGDGETVPEDATTTTTTVAP